MIYTETMNPNGFFKPGNHYSQGRPPKSKNQMERIRSRILQVVKKRIYHEKDLQSVTTTDLLKFLATIMPRDAFGIAVNPQINYISNVPRQVEQVEVTQPPLLAETTEGENEQPLHSGEVHQAVEG
jgi:hypothetical protein